MIDPNTLEYRMYVLSLRQLSSINKGCQGIHVVLEYSQKYGDRPDYKKYVTTDKTVIMLDGGTSPEMEAIIAALTEDNIDYTYLLEPEHNNLITYICLLVDVIVWNETKYNEILTDSLVTSAGKFDYDSWVECIGGHKNATLSKILQGKRLSL